MWRWERSGVPSIRLTSAAACRRLQATGIFGIVCAALAFYNGTSML